MLDRLNYLRMIGTFAPSSSALAKAMTKLVDKKIPQTVLEVGAGTGAITKHLINQTSPQHKVDIVEIMPKLTRLLRMRFAKQAGLSIYGTDLLHFVSKHKYDVIISSLPFNSLHPILTKALIDQLLNLAKPGAYLAFFEYKSMQKFMPFFLPKSAFQQFTESRQIIHDFITRYQVDEQTVNFNMPPALVHYLYIDK